MAEKKKNYDPEDDITGMMFKRAKELGYDVENPATGDAYRERTRKLIADQQKKRKAKK